MTTCILEFLTPGEFDELATTAMVEAFDGATKELHDRGQPAIVREVLARRIIDAAHRGVRDPTCLREAALAALPRHEG